MKVNIARIDCKRCEHKWIPRKRDVRICPKCKSHLWDKRREED